MKTMYLNFFRKIDHFGDILLLLIRLILAYGFYGPALMKIKDVDAIGEWFEGMNMPVPLFMAYLATYTEVIGVVFLVLGLATRIISIPLIITMIVAIKTVHWQNGFNASDNGFEIPLYYILMLLTIFIYGAGKFSLDYLISERINGSSVIGIKEGKYSVK